jgi:hypothetical protein
MTAACAHAVTAALLVGRARHSREAAMRAYRVRAGSPDPLMLRQRIDRAASIRRHCAHAAITSSSLKPDPLMVRRS